MVRCRVGSGARFDPSVDQTTISAGCRPLADGWAMACPSSLKRADHKVSSLSPWNAFPGVLAASFKGHISVAPLRHDDVAF